MSTALNQFIKNSPSMFTPGEELKYDFGPETLKEYSLHDVVNEIDKVNDLDDFAGEKVHLLSQLYMQKYDQLIQPEVVLNARDAETLQHLKKEVADRHDAEREHAIGVLDKVVRTYAVGGGEVWRDMQMDDLKKLTNTVEPKSRGIFSKKPKM